MDAASISSVASIQQEETALANATGVSADLTKLAAFRPRRFVPEAANLADAAVVKGLYSQLLERPAPTPRALEAWLLDRSELEAAVSQTGSILNIRMTCQTDDPERAAAYRAFVETVSPVVKAMSDKLDRKYLEARKSVALDAERLMVYERAMRADVELFREENVPLETQDTLLSQEYQTICGAMTVRFRGEEKTLQQMGKLLLEPDRPLREEAWRGVASRRLQDKARLEEVFDKMRALRAKIAANAGCADFREFQFRAFHRFDYTPADCRSYHNAVEKRVVPVWRDTLLKRRATMKLDALRPWDTAVDPEGKPPLKPFETPPQLIAGVERIFNQVDPALGEQFRRIADLGLLDLASRKGKAPGGYQTTLCEARLPFIFMNAVGVDDDVMTLLHECGHAFHTLSCVDEPLLAYRHGPIEFCEVASMGMELLGGEFMGEFYQGDDLKRSRRHRLEAIAYILPWVATIDAFQHWIYEHPSHDADARRKAWLETVERFGGGVVDWSGLDEERAYAWHRQLHIFEHPFYYIEYGIAQLGALQLWLKAKKDRKAALAAYRRALALGGSRPLPELFAAAGLEFGFAEETIAPLMDALGEELAKV